jgi:signal peptidase I
MTRAWKIVVAIVAVIVLRLAVRQYLVEAYKIPSGAMSPTLVPGDHVFASKWRRGKQPLRGEVIIFAFPENREEDFVFRAVGLPGDTLEVRNARIVLNGKVLPRCIVGHATMDVGGNKEDADFYVEELEGRRYLTQYSVGSIMRTDAGPWTVKPGEVFVLGDNRNNSRDSREWWKQEGGGVPFADIRGRVSRIWLSPGNPHRTGDINGPPQLPDELNPLQPQLQTCLGPNASFE